MNEQTPRSLLTKLASRKLLVALLAIVASFERIPASTTHAVILGVVAVAYIVAEAFIDRADRERIVGALIGGVTEGIKLGKGALDEDDDDDGSGPATPRVLPPEPKAEPLVSPGGKRTLLPAVLAVGMVAVGLGCSTVRRPVCGPDQLTKLEAAYVAEAVAACAGKTTATCDALPAIETKFRAKREEWVQCR